MWRALGASTGDEMFSLIRKRASISSASLGDASRLSMCVATIFWATAGFGADAPKSIGDLEWAEQLYEAKTFGTVDLKYRLYCPHREGRLSSYPLLVVLHGSGERGSDNRKQLRFLPSLIVRPDYQQRFPCCVVAPQCPEGQSWDPQARNVLDLIEHIVQEYPIDARRIYLMGQSMGGSGTWLLASLRPDLFAAAVPIAGGGDPQFAGRLISLPIWAIHGDADRIVPVTDTRSIVTAIRQAGGSPIYTELQNVGHGGSWKYAYALDEEVLPWVFSQRQSWLAWDNDLLTTIIVIVDVLVVLWFIWHVIAKSKGRLSAMVQHQASPSSAAATTRPLPPSTAS
jgi:poly(3-hydroxybutyrate) depolymerase